MNSVRLEILAALSTSQSPELCSWHGMSVLNKYLLRDWRVFIVGKFLTAEYLASMSRSTNLMVKLQDNPHENSVKKEVHLHTDTGDLFKQY